MIKVVLHLVILCLNTSAQLSTANHPSDTPIFIAGRSLSTRDQSLPRCLPPWDPTESLRRTPSCARTRGAPPSCAPATPTPTASSPSPSQRLCGERAAFDLISSFYGICICISICIFSLYDKNWLERTSDQLICRSLLPNLYL